ncbi:hypothetical protein [Porphyromonas sp. HMSC077F02]|uniref:hypothetical protein n=1 Tax=Porphyromonas sp. HMSC077F02 TaxID=1739529 RepID=UPI00143BC52C|nr:hypothetical protein [Porphyromonas sp. HMSC077F02]
MSRAKFDGKWSKDLITGKRKRTAGDDSFLENNDQVWIKLLKGLLDLLHGKRQY